MKPQFQVNTERNSSSSGKTTQRRKASGRTATKPLRRDRRRSLQRPFPLTPLQQLLWGGIGIALTIGGAWMQASIITAPWLWPERGLQFQPLGILAQVGGVLLIACLGGPWAAVGSQLVYLTLGLLGSGVFAHGGGLDYIQRPTFGYLLGFVPGAWLCARLAFRQRVTLEALMFSCLAGLSIIHLMGIGYQVALRAFSELGDSSVALSQGIFQYSIYHLPEQVAMVCAIALIAFVVRRLLFY